MAFGVINRIGATRIVLRDLHLYGPGNNRYDRNVLHNTIGIAAANPWGIATANGKAERPALPPCFYAIRHFPFSVLISPSRFTYVSSRLRYLFA